MLTRSLMRRRGKVLIAAPAAPTARNHHALVGAREVVHQLARLFVKERCADWHLQHNVFAIAARTVRSLAVPSAVGLVLRIESEVHQRVVALARFHNYIAAMAAVPARGTAARHELLAAEGHAPITTVTGFYPDSCLIDKHFYYLVYRIA